MAGSSNMDLQKPANGQVIAVYKYTSSLFVPTSTNSWDHLALLLISKPTVPHWDVILGLPAYEPSASFLRRVCTSCCTPAYHYRYRWRGITDGGDEK